MSEPIIDPDFPPEAPVPPEPEPVEPGPEAPVVHGWTDAPISGDRVNVFDAPIVAGDPDGARIEIRSTGFHAFNGAGIETARIDGQEGVFVGGEFRTSDTLPGQITLSDTANQGTPGLSVEPEDSTGYDVLPSIGPGPAEMHISGGVSTDGTMSGAQFGASGTSIYHNGPGANGTGSWALVNGNEARLAYREDRTNVSRESGMWVRPTSASLFTEGEGGLGSIHASSTAASINVSSIAGNASSDVASVRADLENAMLSMRKQGGRTRRLRVDEGGVWAEIETGPNSWLYDSYNLLETAQDSGWVNLSAESGFTALSGYELRYRNKGGVIFFDGVAVPTSAMTGSWQTIASIPAEACPDKQQLRKAVSSTMDANLRVTNTGSLQVYFLSGDNTSQVHISPMFHVAH